MADKMTPRVEKVKTLSEYRILVTFENGEKKLFDLKPYLGYEVFKPIKNVDEFNKIFIDFGTVCWKCGADLSRDTLYIKGVDYNKQLLQM